MSSAPIFRFLRWAFSSAMERATINASKEDKSEGMYGLVLFINAFRQSKSREDDDKIINKELARIRKHFKKGSVDSYSKRKYVCKLLFIFLMGRKVTFGHFEALSLILSNVYYEKQMGYLFISMLFDYTSEHMHLLIMLIKTDLESGNYLNVDLAMKCIANIGNREMALEFSPVLVSFIESNYGPDYLMQSTLLGYLKLYRAARDIKTPDICKIFNLMSDRDQGVMLCATTLIDELTRGSHDYSENLIVRIAVTELSKIMIDSPKEVRKNCAVKCNMPAASLPVNLLRLLQNFSVPKEMSVKKMLNDVLDIILVRTQEPPLSVKELSGQRVPGNYGTHKHLTHKYVIFFEAVNVIALNTDNFEMRSRVYSIIDDILAANIPDLKYMAFETMSRLAISDSNRKSLMSYKEKALYALRNDADVSIQHKAANFLYSICDQSNANCIVRELLDLLESVHYTIKESLALRIVIIADHWFSNYFWYIDAMLKLISISGNSIDYHVYFKVIRIVSNVKEVQKHATYSAFHYVKQSTHNEILLRVAGFFLGNFGYLIKDYESSSIPRQWELLLSKYAYCDSYTKATLLSSFMKIAHRFPEMRSSAEKVFSETSRSTDLEIQNRSVEYLKLLRGNIDPYLHSAIFQDLPPINDGVLRMISKRNGNLALTGDEDSRRK